MSKYQRFDVSLTGTRAFAEHLRDFESLPARAQQRAVSTLRRRVKTETRRDIQGEYNLKAGRITQGLRIRATDDVVTVVGSSRGINAMAFGATWSRNRRGKSKIGASFRIKRGEAKTPQEGSFIATGRSGNRLVFEREGRARLPISGVYGPSIAQMLKHGRRPERIAEFAARILADETTRLAVREQEKLAEKAIRRR